jgi:hypothetical protein
MFIADDLEHCSICAFLTFDIFYFFFFFFGPEISSLELRSPNYPLVKYSHHSNWIFV